MPELCDLKIVQKIQQTHQGQTQLQMVQNMKTFYVLKSITKNSVINDAKKIEHVSNEKEALKHFTERSSKGINHIVKTYQDQQKLYILLKPQWGLPLHKLLQMMGNFNSSITKLIATQIGLILKEFHQEGFIYRDIKASNFIIDVNGRISMVDLGLSKKIGKNGRTYTICGTTHAIPPEVYQENGYGLEFDYYSFGIIIYEMLVGKAPFGYGNSNKNIKEEIQKGINLSLLEVIDDKQAQSLISSLLEFSESRLGCKTGFQEILQHQYFNVPEFLDYKDIYEGVEVIDRQDPNFEFFVSEIEDFGLQEEKYGEIQQKDPFYKFFGE